MKKLAFMWMAAALVAVHPACAEPAANPDAAAQDAARARQAEAEARRQMEISRIEAAGSQQRAASGDSDGKAREAAQQAERRRAEERAKREAANREGRGDFIPPKRASRPGPTRDLDVEPAPPIPTNPSPVSRIEAPDRAVQPRERP